ncbi:hypothetical protein L7F22_037676 [Adiantum nelumboides]|nr:hypothetical protein [Adiantum nelumboides]
MRTQLLQLPSPLLGKSANKRAVEVDNNYPPHYSLRDTLFHQPFSEFSTFQQVRGRPSILTASVSFVAANYVCQDKHLKKQVLACSSLGNTHTNLRSHIFDFRRHFGFELPELLGYNSVRLNNKLRVSAQNEESHKSWLQRFLFSPLDPEEYPFLVNDPNEDSDVEAEDDFEGQKGTGKRPTGDEWCKDDIDRMLADDASFAAWQQRVKAQNELRESQELGRDPDNKNWEDWLDDSWGDYSEYVGGKDSGWYFDESDWEKGGVPRSPPKLPERGMGRNMKEMLFRIFEDEEEVKADLDFEDRVFRFTSQTTVSAIVLLVFVMHHSFSKSSMCLIFARGFYQRANLYLN